MSVRRRRVLTMVLAVLGGGCGQNVIRVSLNSFDRPGAMSFLCTDRATGALLPLSRCSFDAAGIAPTDTVMYALVTQTRRGEIALVKLDAPTNTFSIIDTDQRIPGYTFVPVGELPSAIVTPRNNASRTFVAHTGSRDLWSVPTQRFFPSGATEEPIEKLTFDSRPTDLAYSPDEQTLYVALPDQGSIAVIPTLPGQLNAGRILPVGAVVPSFAESPSSASQQKTCPPGAVLVEPAPNATRTPISLGDKPRPVSFIVDDNPGDPRLLVADEALPVIHVFRLPTMEPLPSLAPGVPVRKLALTPRVPNTLNGDASQTARYLYAVDATDGSLIVLDYDSGAVLAIDPHRNRPSDRVAYAGVVQTIEIVTPGFATDAELCTSGSERASIAGPDRLRGVFLAVGLSDGTVRFIDVEDLDAPCRGGVNCTNPQNSLDEFVFIRRHRPRIGTYLTNTVELASVPGIAGAGSLVRIGPDGVTAPQSIPDLVPFQAGCPEFMTKLFTADAPSPLLCGVTDPWAAGAETWNAVLGGPIPGASGQRGRLLPSDARLTGEASFCERGVLGVDDSAATPASEPEHAYAGDQVVILSDPPKGAPARCTDFIQTDTSGRRVAPAFRIRQAYADHLDVEPASLGDGNPDIATIAECYGEFVQYEVRTLAAYAVTGSSTGFLHRVRTAADGRCVVDAGVDVHYQGRALPMQPYVNPRVAFTLTIPQGIANGVLSFEVGRVPTQLGIDIDVSQAGILPVSLAYNPSDRNLYALEASQKGLIQLALDRLEVERSIE